MDQSDKLQAYLYGELSGEGRDALEDKIFADEEFAAEVDDFESTLIDSFVRGEMTAGQMLSFQEMYLTSETRRARVNLARSLNNANVLEPKIAGTAAESESAGWLEGIMAFFGNRGSVYAGAATAVIVVIGGLWFLSTLPGDEVVHRVPENSVTEIVPAIPEAVTNPIPPENNGNNAGATRNGKRDNGNNGDARNGTNHAVSESPRTFAFTLLPPSRSSGRPVLEIPKGTNSVRIMIVHDNKTPYAKYKFELKDNNGSTVLIREINLTPKTVERPVSMSFRADRLKSGSYEVTLVGSTPPETDEEIGFYSFSVKK